MAKVYDNIPKSTNNELLNIINNIARITVSLQRDMRVLNCEVKCIKIKLNELHEDIRLLVNNNNNDKSSLLSFDDDIYKLSLYDKPI